jgi:predicted CoA-substrate-specific enzyme activase
VNIGKEERALEGSAPLVIGVDLGKTTVSLAAACLSDDGTPLEAYAVSERHLGDPLRLFSDLYRKLDHSRIRFLAATGLFSERLEPPVLSGVPEETAQEVATFKLHSGDGPVNVLRLGGRGYSILTVDERGRVRFEENDKCSSGTGETVEKICRRLGLGLDDAIRLAEGAPDSISVSARCSVFVKSEITHFANQGEPHDRLILGYFESVARNLFSLYEKFKVDGPVLLIGNGAYIKPVVDALARMCSVPVRLSPRAGVYEALGAMYLAADRARESAGESGARERWPSDPRALIGEKQKRIQKLCPASRAGGSVIQARDGRARVAPRSPVIMGIDLGSTGSKAALVDLETGSVIADLYRRTDGNPVEAARALVAGLSQMTDHPLQAIGLTGSGRYAAATVFRAAYADSASRIYVENEILAHARAAVAYDDQKGKSLSIVEIGGQDAKFINIEDGRVIESDMNRACSAGTGSFLEEQSQFYGVQDIASFGPMAERSDSPPDLGQMCTVFVADLAGEARSEGYTLEDLFAGFQYSVIINYKNRVMGNRRFLDRIFFQGKPASNASLARTLAAVTGRQVVVPPNPGAMGAVGITLMARDELEGLKESEPLDPERILRAEITSRKITRCQDKKCGNMCRIESAKVQVAEESRTIVSGGRCPKYEEAAAGRKKLPREAPDPYRERERLLQELIASGDSRGKDSREAEEATGRSICLPLGHYLLELAPFFLTFLRELGLRPIPVRSDRHTLPRGNGRCSAANTCTPVKIMHGLADADADTIFMPRIVNAPREAPASGVSTCPMTQAAPQMIEEALRAEGSRARVERPAFHMEGGLGHWKFALELRAFRQAFGRRLASTGYQLGPFFRAYGRALSAQQRYRRGLEAIGRRALDFAGQHGYPVVLVVGNCHVIHEPIMNAGIHDIVAREGAMALPVDCYPIEPSTPPLQRVYWVNASRTLRASIDAAKRGGIFPALIISYGCGPGSFLEQLFNDLLEGYPHTVLESDGHGGQAGYVTRVQAFLHAARTYRRGAGPALDRGKIASYDRFPERSQQELLSSRISVMTVGPTLGRHITASLQTHGYQAEFAGLSDAEGFKLGRRSCTGKECLPYQLIWGSFEKHLRQNPPPDGRKTYLLNVTGFGPCRNGMFTLGNEIALRKKGLEDRVQPVTYGSFRDDTSVFGGIWYSMVMTDLLSQMRFHYRAVESRPGDSDRLFGQYANRIEELIRRQSGSGRLLSVLVSLPAFEKLIVEAARAFRALPVSAEREQQARTVFLSGDIYLRIDEWGSDELARKLNDHGLYVVLEPFTEIFEFLVDLRSPELVEIDTRLVPNRGLRAWQRLLDRRLYRAAGSILPFISPLSVRAVEAESRQLLDDGIPFSESLLTIGSTLLAWRKRQADGVVVVGPWGCGPALISEAQLRRRADIPLLFIYNDGDPIDQAKIAGFAWRLKRSAPRV